MSAQKWTCMFHVNELYWETEGKWGETRRRRTSHHSASGSKVIHGGTVDAQWQRPQKSNWWHPTAAQWTQWKQRPTRPFEDGFSATPPPSPPSSFLPMGTFLFFLPTLCLPPPSPIYHQFSTNRVWTSIYVFTQYFPRECHTFVVSAGQFVSNSAIYQTFQYRDHWRNKNARCR